MRLSQHPETYRLRTLDIADTLANILKEHFCKNSQFDKYKLKPIKMEKSNKLEIIGFALLAIGGLFWLSEKILRHRRTKFSLRLGKNCITSRTRCLGIRINEKGG